MHRHGCPVIKQSRLKAGVKKRKIDSGSGRANQLFLRSLGAKGATNRQRQRYVLVNVWPRRPERRMVGFVVNFPNHTATREVFCGGHGPTRECLPGTFIPRWRAVVVKRIAIIKDQQRMNVVGLERSDQTIIAGEVVPAWFCRSEEHT